MQPEFTQFSTSACVDAEYRFRQPKVYLAPHELARVTILRSRLGETRAERAAEADTTRRATASRPSHR